MHNSRILFAVLATAIGVIRGQDLDSGDVPQQCRSICDPVIQLENQCDNQFDDDNNDNRNGNNQQYRDCICNAQNARQALQTCQDCVVQYPNFFIDNDNVNDRDDNEIEQWLVRCNFANGTGLAGTTGTPTRGPGATGIFSGSLTTATYTYTDIDNDRDNDDQPETRTRTTVYPIGAWTSGTFTGSYGSLTTSTVTYTDSDFDDTTIDLETRTLVFPVGAIPTIPGQNLATATTPSVSFTQVTTTNAAGNTVVSVSPATTFDGAAAVATAGPLLGAGMAIMLAGMAL